MIVNFLYHFTRLRHAQIAHKTLFLGMSVRAFLEEIGIWIDRLSEDECPHQRRWTSSNPQREQIEPKSGGGVNLLSELDVHFLLLSDIGRLLKYHHHTNHSLVINTFPFLSSTYLIYQLLVLFLWRALIDEWDQNQQVTYHGSSEIINLICQTKLINLNEKFTIILKVILSQKKHAKSQGHRPMVPGTIQICQY